jgi:hypothetical protein
MEGGEGFAAIELRTLRAAGSPGLDRTPDLIRALNGKSRIKNKRITGWTTGVNRQWFDWPVELALTPTLSPAEREE